MVRETTMVISMEEIIGKEVVCNLVIHSIFYQLSNFNQMTYRSAVLNQALIRLLMIRKDKLVLPEG